MPEIVIDFQPIIDYIDYISLLPLYLIVWEIIRYGGWIILLVPILVGFKAIYLNWIMGKFASKQTYIFLAIDIPRNNEQTPKAFENIFNQLAGAHSNPWWWEVWTEGVFQQSLSFEIVSLEGHIQFIVGLNQVHRDLVESAIFAQYPEAEITEVEDYTREFDKSFPNDEYDIWGTDFVHVKHFALPIKVYRAFGDDLNQEYKDPMAAFLENMTRIGKGEHLWYQIILTPIDQSWVKQGQAEIAKALGKKPPSKKTIFDSILKIPMSILSEVGNMVFGTTGGSAGGDEARPPSLQDLPPGDVLKIKSMEEKCSKIGYRVKIRTVYLAKHEAFSKAKVAYSLIGAIKQFNTENLNSLKPDMKNGGTGGDFFFKKKKVAFLNRRKKTLFWAYTRRIGGVGGKPMILNTEELASLYHFPLATVKASMLKKIEVKTAEPPVNLPDTVAEELLVQNTPAFDEVVEDEIKSVKQQVDNSESLDYNDDYFEQRFAKDPQKRKPRKQEQQRDKRGDEIVLPQTSIETDADNANNVRIVAPKVRLEDKKQDPPEDNSKGAPPTNLPI